MTVIWFILKFIGILFLILLFAIIALLILPICYQGKVDFNGSDIKAKAKVSWALLFLRVNVRYEDELFFIVRIFGIPIYCSDEKRWTVLGGSDDVVQEKKSKKKKSKVKKSKQEEVKSEPVKVDEIKEEAKEYSQDVLDMTIDDFEDEEEQDISFEEEEKASFFSKIKGFVLKITEFFGRMWRKIKGIQEKGQSIISLLEDEEVKAAIGRVKDYGLTGSKLLLPQTVKGDLYFGFDDPAMTGKILGYGATAYGLYGEHLNLHPDFTKQILKGNLLIKGQLRRYRLIMLAWKIWKDKDLIRQKDRVSEIIGG